MSKLVLDWQEALTTSSTVCGGKGWNLAQLHHYGFDIPRGFILSATLYQELLSNHDPYQGFKDGRLPEAVMQQIETALTQLGLNNQPLAIRSSATLEDSNQASFAGIHESYLNVRGTTQIEQAILACYASLWSERAISYRHKMGITDDEIACAVVISELIEANASGIAFSCDPASGSTDLITINANFGLGESVVSGATTPDHYSVHYHHQEIAAKQLGKKDKQTIAVKQGTALVDQPGVAHRSVLNDTQISQLARLVLRVFHVLGHSEQHQDIEWLFDGERFLLTQARPVTALPTVTLPELTDQDEVWTAGNFRDAIPMVLPAMSSGFARYHIDNIMRHTVDGTGYTLPEGINFGRYFEGRFYCNATLMQWLWYDIAGLEPRVTNMNLGGHQEVMKIDLARHSSPAKTLKRLLGSLKFLRYVEQQKKRTPVLYAEIAMFIDSVMQRDFTTLSDEALLELYYEIDDRITDYDGPFITLTAASGAIFVIVQILEKKLGNDAANVANTLLTGSAKITSAEQGYELMALAELVDEDNDAKAWFSSANYEPLQWREALPDHSPFKQAFQHYLAEYGHRAVYEIDFTRPRWHEDPSYLLNTVKHSMSKHPLKRIKAQQAKQVTEAWQRIDQLFPWATRKLLRYLAKRAAEGAGVREMAKSTYVKFLTPMRALMLETGRRLAERGLIEQRNDIIHCHFTELVTIFKQEWDGASLRTIVEARKQYQAMLEKITPPDVIVNDAPKIVPQPITAEKHKLVGVAVAPGSATGPAHVAQTPEQGVNIPDGYVLVTPSTDPGWTPLFLNATALVMETGGYLSHGSIVAREYGIPAVVNVASAMSMLQAGEQLKVNGNEGTVEKLS